MPHCARDAPLCDATCRQPQVMPQATGARTPAAAVARCRSSDACSAAIMAVSCSSDSGCDLRGEEGRVVAHPAEQRRAPGVLPAPTERVEPRRGSHSARLPQAPLRVGGVRDVDPRVVRSEPVAHMTTSYWPEVPSTRGRSVMPWRRASRRGLVPTIWSRPASRRPSRDCAGTRSRRRPLAHHQTSRPSGRWGTAGMRLPAERSTVRDADSSRAIWHPGRSSRRGWWRMRQRGPQRWCSHEPKLPPPRLPPPPPTADG